VRSERLHPGPHRACFISSDTQSSALCEGRRVIAMCGGDHHTLAVTQSGQLLSFGRPTYGRLGRTDVDVNSDDPIHTPEVRASE